MALTITHRRQFTTLFTAQRITLIAAACLIALSSLTVLWVKQAHAAPTNYTQTGWLRPHIQLTDSLGMSLDSAGNRYVAETYGYKIRKFSPSGQLLMTIGNNDWSDSTDGLGYLLDTAVDSHGTIYASDTDNNRIQVYDKNGNYLRSISSEGGNFFDLYWLAVDSSDNLYASDGTRVQVFDPSGTYVKSISTPDMSHVYPSGYVSGNIRSMNIDKNDNLYVTEGNWSTMSQVQKFSSDGTLVGTYGTYNASSSNPTPGAMLQPQAVAVDSQGNIFVDDLDYINEFSSTGTPISKTFIGFVGGEEQGEVQDMSFDSSDNLQIINTRPNRILTLDHNLQYVSQVGQSGTQDGYTYGTLGVYRDEAAGKMYVSDAINSRIQVFDLNGNFLTKFGTHGTGPGQFNRPGHITKNPITGNLYINDMNGVEIFTPSGTYVNRLTGLGPAGIAFDASGKMYTATSQYSTPSGGAIRDNDGNVLSTFGATGTPATGKINYPSKVTLDASGNIYVADVSSSYIQIYAPDGTFLRNIGGVFGSGDGQFSQPNDLRVTSDGTVYVADTGNGRFQIFDNTGAYVGQFGSQGFGPGKFQYPQAFSIASDGTMYIADDVNDFIAIYKPSSNTAPSAPTNFTVTGDSSASWSAPASNGGSSIASYKLRHKSTTATNWIEVTLPAGTTSYSFGTQPADTYQYELTASNSAGESIAAIPGSGVTTSSSPQSVTAASLSANTINTSWQAPTTDGGSAITSYLFEYKPSADVTWSQLTLPADATSHTLTGVPAGSYDVRVSATNSIGTSSPSSVATVTVAGPATPPPTVPAPTITTAPSTPYVAPPAAPAAPSTDATSSETPATPSTDSSSAPTIQTSVSTSQPGSVTVTWQPPAGESPSSYVIENRNATVPPSDTTTPWQQVKTAGPNDHSATFTLPIGSYIIRVAALFPGEHPRIILGVAHITIPASEASLPATTSAKPSLLPLATICAGVVMVAFFILMIVWKRKRRKEANLPPRWQ